jgi:hypothetical protein
MNPVRRLAAALTGLAGALLAFAAAAPAALSRPFPPRPPGWDKHPPPTRAGIHVVVVGGMPGWQITLIAIGAALLAATAAVLVDRARAAHRTTITAARLNHSARQPVLHRPQPGPGGVTADQPGR